MNIWYLIFTIIILPVLVAIAFTWKWEKNRGAAFEKATNDLVKNLQAEIRQLRKERNDALKENLWYKQAIDAFVNNVNDKPNDIQIFKKRKGA